MANKKSSGKKSAAKTKKNNLFKKLLIALAVIVFLLVIAVVVIYFVKPTLFDELFNRLEDYYAYVQNYYNDSDKDDPDGTNGATVQISEGDAAGIKTSDFSIHFLELGNKYTGDCTLIDIGDTEILIDAGSRKSSATTITSYVREYCEDGVLEYVIATHAHQDHIAGFVGNSSNGTRTGVLYQFEVGTLIQFAGHNTTANIYNEYVTAVDRLKEGGTNVYTAADCWYERNGAQKSYDLTGDGTLTLNVLYNYYYENTTADENDYSVCVLLTYAPEGGTPSHYLFTGDLEGEGEKKLVQYNDLPKVELFKGGHHGSKTSTTDELLAKIQPKYVAVCCCTGSTEYTTANANTFPTQAFIDRVSKYTDSVYCTSIAEGNGFASMNGNIVFYMSGKELKLWCSANTTKLKDTQWFKENRTCPQSWQ